MSKYVFEFGSEVGCCVGCVKEICSGEEGFVLVVEIGDEEMVLEGIEFGVVVVEELG